MDDTTLDQVVDEAGGPTGDVERDATAAGRELVEELLVEEISIDGMCGVY